VTRMELVAISGFVARGLVFVLKTPDPDGLGRCLRVLGDIPCSRRRSVGVVTAP
jgi:hypothetical protein